MTEIQSTSLSPEVISRLDQIFKSKSWPLDDPELGDEPSLFETFCHLFSILSQDEQKLLLNLSEDFIRCTLLDYSKLMYIALNKVDSMLINAKNKVYLLPLVSPMDVERGKIKSGHPLIYITEHLVIPSHQSLRNKDVRAIHSPNGLDTNRTNSLLLCIDDFIGSGETALKFLDNYSCSFKVDSDSLIVVALVTQEIGMNKIRDIGYEVVSAHVRKRGISDSERIPDINAALAVIDQIESRLSISDKYRRGYAQSEALVQMIRTPNNTFPIFWCENAKENTSWPAPFPRR